jgi:hypothetical protein
MCPLRSVGWGLAFRSGRNASLSGTCSPWSWLTRVAVLPEGVGGVAGVVGCFDVRRAWVAAGVAPGSVEARPECAGVEKAAVGEEEPVEERSADPHPASPRVEINRTTVTKTARPHFALTAVMDGDVFSPSRS